MRKDSKLDLIISDTQVEDAAEILTFLKIVGGETHNLTFGEEGVSLSVEEEQQRIQETLQHPINAQWKACIDGTIVGICDLRVFPQKRLQHRCEFGISVKKAYWHRGIGKAMLAHLLNYATQQEQLRIITLEVLEDNEAAIHLYESFGFSKAGYYKKFYQIDGNDYGAYFMDKELSQRRNL